MSSNLTLKHICFVTFYCAHFHVTAEIPECYWGEWLADWIKTLRETLFVPFEPSRIYSYRADTSKWNCTNAREPYGDCERWLLILIAIWRLPIITKPGVSPPTLFFLHTYHSRENNGVLTGDRFLVLITNNFKNRFTRKFLNARVSRDEWNGGFRMNFS